MRIVYLGDWGETKNGIREKILGKFGDEIWSPDVLYTHNRNIISNLADNIHCNNSNSNLIVGCGVGAYIGFYISNMVKVPSLLFNPSFYYKNGSELKSQYDHEQFIEKRIILSALDEIIDNKRVYKFLKELGYDYQIKIFDNLTHDISNDLVDQIFTDFRDKYKTFEQVKKNTIYGKKVKVKLNRRYDVPPNDEERRNEPEPDGFWDPVPLQEETR